MVEKTTINPGAPFSGAKIAGNMIFVSGQVPIIDGKCPDTIEEQTEACLDRILKILIQAGAGLADIVKMTVFLTDIQDFGRFNQAYIKFFNEHGITDSFPARAAMEIGGLVKPEWKIEIDAFAVL